MAAKPAVCDIMDCRISIPNEPPRIVDATRMPEERETLWLKLPPEAVANDADLHGMAQRVFLSAQVRSLIIDSGRTAAVVRLKPGAHCDVAAISCNGFTSSSDKRVLTSSTIAELQRVELLSWIDPRDGSISFIKMPDRVRGWRKALYLALAGAALSLGLLGIVLPGLPTTPFVLLGSYFLVRSSTRLHERLMASRVFGGVLRDWYIHRGLRPHVRARAMAVVALVVGVSLLIARPPLPALLLIVSLAACGLIVIWRLPTVPATALERG